MKTSFGIQIKNQAACSAIVPIKGSVTTQLTQLKQQHSQSYQKINIVGGKSFNFQWNRSKHLQVGGHR